MTFSIAFQFAFPTLNNLLLFRRSNRDTKKIKQLHMQVNMNVFCFKYVLKINVLSERNYSKKTLHLNNKVILKYYLGMS